MKKLIFIILLGCLGINAWGQQYRNKPQLTPEEFRAQQEAFITEKASLTQNEAKDFFPLFFELQDKKKEINTKVSKLLKKGKDKDTSEKQYEEIIEQVLDLRIQSCELEKEYYKRFKKILSPKKVYKVQTAEMSFHRELLKDIKQVERDRKHDKK